MATDGCRKESRKWCEIHVSVDAPPLHDLGMYRRLRFGLLASSWLPSCVGRFFWISLHVHLIVGGPVLAMPIWLTYISISTGFLLSFFPNPKLLCTVQLLKKKKSKTEEHKEVTGLGFFCLRRVAAMATDGCRKESRKWCEIHVSVDAPPLHDLGMYRRLRFGLLASSWLPSCVGRFFWIVLHLLLIVGGPVFVMVIWLTKAFIGIGMFISFCLVNAPGVGLCAVFTLAIDFVLLLVRSIRFCWSVVCNHVSFLASQESTILVWSGKGSYTVELLKEFMEFSLIMFGILFDCVVPFERSKLHGCEFAMMGAWVRWCKEMLYMPDAIAI